MGSLFSNNYQILQDRLSRLESAADLNKDGFVTKKELDEYISRQLADKDAELSSLRIDKMRLQEKLDQERKNVIKWKQAYDDLHKRHEDYLQMLANKENDASASPASQHISNQAIGRFVDELLEDPNINIYMLPDSIEKPLYVNFLKIFLSLLQKILHNTNLDLIGHEFKVNMRPTLETQLLDSCE